MRRIGTISTISTAAQTSSATEQRANRSGSISSWSALTWPPIRPAAVAQRAGAEPQPHHLPAHSLRRQQRHGGQPDRAQAQLTQRQHQDTAHQPHRRYAGAAVAQHILRGQHHQAETTGGAQDTDHELGDAARAHVIARQRRPCPAEHRCQQDDEQGVDRLEPHRRDLEVADHAIGVIVGEQVERGRLLFKRRPEERGGDQQDEAHQQACTLFAAQAGKGEQVDEIQGDRRGDDVHQHAGYLNRVDDDGALSDQHDDRS